MHVTECRNTLAEECKLMNTSETNQYGKYTAITIVFLGSLLLIGLIGLFIVFMAQPDNELPTTSDDIASTPFRDEIVRTPTHEAGPTKANVETTSAHIIAPLLSFDEDIAMGDVHTYLFQAVADTPLLITLETTYDLRLKMQILDRGDDVVYETNLGRGVHETRFNPDVSGEYRIKIEPIKGQGRYTIRMDFAVEDDSHL